MLTKVQERVMTEALKKDNWRSEAFRKTEPASFLPGQAPRRGQILVGRAGLPSLCYPRQDGQELTLNSLVDPIEEAAWFQDAVQEGQLPEGALVLVMGFGMGWHLLALHKGLESLAHPPVLWVMEYHPDLFLHALGNVDLSPVTASPGFRCFVGEDPELMEGALRKALEEAMPSALLILEHPPSVALAKERYGLIACRVHAWLQIARLKTSEPALLTRLGRLSEEPLEDLNLKESVRLLLSQGGPLSRGALTLLALDSILNRE
jgi:hypothetical protein